MLKLGLGRALGALEQETACLPNYAPVLPKLSGLASPTPYGIVNLAKVAPEEALSMYH